MLQCATSQAVLQAVPAHAAARGSQTVAIGPHAPPNLWTQISSGPQVAHTGWWFWESSAHAARVGIDANVSAIMAGLVIGGRSYEAAGGPRRIGDAGATAITGRAHFRAASAGEVWHAHGVSPRTLVAALIAAAVGLGTVHSADAQLWKPKKKPAATAPAAKKARPARPARKKPARKKPANSVVRFQPPPDRDDDRDRDADADSDVDDNPRITVVDGDRDE